MCVAMLSNCTQNMNNFAVWIEPVDKYHLMPELSTHLPFDNWIKRVHGVRAPDTGQSVAMQYGQRCYAEGQTVIQTQNVTTQVSVRSSTDSECSSRGRRFPVGDPTLSHPAVERAG